MNIKFYEKELNKATEYFGKIPDEHVRQKLDYLRLIKGLEKNIEKSDDNTMYLDPYRAQGKNKQRCAIYYNGESYEIEGRFSQMVQYINKIRNDDTRIYINTSGIGIGIADGFDLANIKYKKLKINKL